jgi:general secretion pathway protein B
MSFILDALKKSESDRQRQNGPALFEVRVAPPRTRLPLWAIAIALLLVVNLGVVIWMLLRHQEHARTPLASTTAAPATGLPAAAAGAQPQSPGASTAAPAGTATPVPVVATSAPASAGTAPPASPGASPAPAAAPPAAEAANAADYAPAEEPAPSALGSHVRRGTESGVPLYQDLTTTAGTRLPQLRLDLHVFAARPQDRFVMINMHKLREGDTLPEGVHVDSITPEGAVLSFNGSKFLLPRD